MLIDAHCCCCDARAQARHGGQLMLWSTAERACIGYTAVPFVPACVAASAEHIAVCSHSAPATVHMYSIVRDHTRNGNSSNGQSNCKLQLVTVFTLPASVHSGSSSGTTAAGSTSGSDTVMLTKATGKSLHASPPRGFGSTFTGSVDGGASQVSTLACVWFSMYKNDRNINIALVTLHNCSVTFNVVKQISVQ
jgi:hypothetical protein